MLLLWNETLEQKLSIAFGARVTFLLRGQEKSNQKRRPPHLALAGHRATAPALPQLGHPCPRHARQVREPGSGFSSGLLPARKGVAILGNARCAALSAPPHRRTGAPGRATGHPGPYSGWSQAKAKAEAEAKPLTSAFPLSEGRSRRATQRHPSTPPLRGYAQGDRTVRKKAELHAATLSQRRSRCAPSARHDGALLYPGPL